MTREQNPTQKSCGRNQGKKVKLIENEWENDKSKYFLIRSHFIYG